MKEVIKNLTEIIFVISLTLIGKFDESNLILSSYQIIVVLFWISGILKFAYLESSMKECLIDAFKNLIIAIAVIPLWYWISGNMENGISETLTILIHFIVLMIVVKITKESVESCGPVSYFTHGIIPIIAIILIRLGMPCIPSVIIALIIPEPINYFFYKDRKNGEK